MTASASAPDPRQFRASDQDRERVVQILNTAMAEGRLTIDELTERIDSAYHAKTIGELEPITADLPAHQALWPAVPQQPLPLAANDSGISHYGGSAPTISTGLAVLSSREIKGQWTMPSQFTAFAMMGSVEIDLTEANFARGEVTITAIAYWGSVEITVPDDITVICSGLGILGAFEDNAHVRGVPGAPVLRVNGIAIMAGVEIKRAKGKKKELR